MYYISLGCMLEMVPKCCAHLMYEYNNNEITHWCNMTFVCWIKSPLEIPIPIDVSFGIAMECNRKRYFCLVFIFFFHVMINFHESTQFYWPLLKVSVEYVGCFFCWSIYRCIICCCMNYAYNQLQNDPQ